MNRERFTVYPNSIDTQYQSPQIDEATPYGKLSAEIAISNERYVQLESQGLLVEDDEAAMLAVDFLRQKLSSDVASLKNEGVAVYQAEVEQYNKECELLKEALRDAEAVGGRHAEIAAIVPEVAEQIRALDAPLIDETKAALEKLDERHSHLFAPWSVPLPELRQLAQDGELVDEAVVTDSVAVSGLVKSTEVARRAKPSALKLTVRYLMDHPGQYFTAREITEAVHFLDMDPEIGLSQIATALYRLRNRRATKRLEERMASEGWRFEVAMSDKGVKGSACLIYCMMRDEPDAKSPSIPVAPVDTVSEPVADVPSVAAKPVSAPSPIPDAPEKRKGMGRFAQEAMGWIEKDILPQFIDEGISPDSTLSVERLISLLDMPRHRIIPTKPKDIINLQKQGVLPEDRSADVTVPQSLVLAMVGMKPKVLSSRKGNAERLLAWADITYRAMWG
ncbi:MAG: hypothetical protein Q4A37_03265 [Candidatus Saccharibacteria bacterium]|nr:hypothetical protein [Candidatus Saccharibacteria bacterium]